MIELLGNAIRVTAGDCSSVAAVIRQSDGTVITEGNMKLVIPEFNCSITGTYANNVWTFEIPSSVKRGRYMYSFMYNDTYLDFESAIYFC